MNQRLIFPEFKTLTFVIANSTIVIANKVKQSMTSDCMDCRATLAVTKSLFMVCVWYLAGFGKLAMTILSVMVYGSLNNGCKARGRNAALA